MNKSQTINSAPPKLIQTFVAGFNATASHAYLLILPVAIDLLLWFGPRLRLRGLLTPLVENANRYLQQINSTDMAARLDAVGQIWGEILNRFNLISFLRTYPVGVPSLLASQSPLDSPLGAASVIEVDSLLTAGGWLMAILLIGFILGCVYFSLLARITSPGKSAFEMKIFATQVGQMLLLTVGLIALLVLLSLPGLLLLSVFALINPGLADIAMIVMFFIVLWILVPLVFTPHSIFTGQRNLLASIATSVRLVRFFLPGTGVFLLFAILISQGLDILWRIPPPTSWMTAVGIFGHAFIYTSLFAASFVYFQGGMRWMIHNITKQRPQEIKI